MLAKICNTFSALMVMILVTLLLLLVGPRLLGWETMNVETASMEPTIPVGSLVTLNTKVTPDDLQPGDVITFSLSSGSMPATHRLMEKLDDQQLLITKGDNNDIIDSPVDYSRLQGRIEFSVPRLGDFAKNMTSRQYIFPIMGYLIVFVLLLFIPEIFKKEN